ERAAAEARAKAEARRRRTVLVAGGLLSAVLAAGVVGTGVGLFLAVRARDAETRQRLKAEGDRELALSALDATTDPVVGDVMASQTAVTPEQKKFLQTVLPVYRRLAEEEGGDRAAHERTARAALRVGLICDRLGQFEESLAAWQAARRRREELGDGSRD